jgi:predicted TIM-barrel fold metal-dependent hydrolase
MRADELPSDLFRRQMFVCTWFENLREDAPLDSLMFETDYPHPTCLMGDEIVDAIALFDQLSQDERDKVLWKNAMRCHNLQPEDVGGTV